MKPELEKKHYILWADDDQEDLMIMRDALETFDQDHIIVEAHNGKQVIDYLHTIKDPSLYPCLIILDMNMPVLDGRETLKLLKSEQKYSSIPVVMLTTSESEMDRMFCRRFVVELFTKPNSFHEHQEIIKKMLGLCHPAHVSEKQQPPCKLFQFYRK